VLGGPELIRAVQWSKIYRFGTDRGNVYLKWSAPAYAREAALMARLGGQFPAVILPVLAHDVALGAFLMPDGCEPLRGKLKESYDQRFVGKLLGRYAGIQRVHLSSIGLVRNFSLVSGMILSYFIRNQGRRAAMRNAEKVTITLTADLLQSVRDTVEAGEFATTSEAMRDAVRVWQRQRLEDTERLNAMRARIRRSLDDPRSSLSAEEAEAEMSRFMKGQEKAARNAAR